MNEIGGYRKDLVVALTGLDIEEKARLVEDAFWRAGPFRRDEYDSVTTQLLRTDKADAPTNEEAVALWRLTLKDRDEHKVGRAVADAASRTRALDRPRDSSFRARAPRRARPTACIAPRSVPSNLVPQYITVLGGERTVIDSVAPTRAVHVVANRRIARGRSGRFDTTLAPLGRSSAHARATRAGTPISACLPAATRRSPGSTDTSPSTNFAGCCPKRRARDRALSACPACAHSTSSFTICSTRAWPPRPAKTPRQRVSASGCAAATSRSPTPCSRHDRIDRPAPRSREEHESLDAWSAEIDATQWHRATPSPGWSVADQIAHLTVFRRGARRSPCSIPRVPPDRDTLARRARTERRHGRVHARRRCARLDPRELLARWRVRATRFDDAARGLERRRRVDWYGPSMSAKSFLSARLMETWAHGTDVVDALGRRRPTRPSGSSTSPSSAATRDAGRTRYAARRCPRARSASNSRARRERRGPGDPTTADDTVSGARRSSAWSSPNDVTSRTPPPAGALGTDWLLRAQAFAGAATTTGTPGTLVSLSSGTVDGHVRRSPCRRGAAQRAERRAPRRTARRDRGSELAPRDAASSW